MSSNQTNLCVILTIFVLIITTTNVVQCQVPQQQQQHLQQQQQTPALPFRQSRYSQSTDLKNMMSELNDRVSVLASLDEDSRNRLESIDKKIVQFEQNNLARLDSLSVQQLDTGKQIELIEHLTRMNNQQIEMIKQSLRRPRPQLEQGKPAAAAVTTESPLSRVQRQIPMVLNDTKVTLNVDTKLDALGLNLLALQATLNEVTKQLKKPGRPLNRNGGKRTGICRQPQSAALPELDITYTGCATAVSDEEAEGTNIQKLQLTPTAQPFYVVCDYGFEGGWTIIQLRYNGNLNFERDWLEYKRGFGNLADEFWMGLEKLHSITSKNLHELLILMQDFQNVTRYARYSHFAIGGEEDSYALNLLGEFSGNAGDSLRYQAGSKFSTFDNDNDGWVDGNCALAHRGAWWHNSCEQSNLNGVYLNGSNENTWQGMYWHDFRGPNYSLKSVKMMIRPIDFEAARRR